MGYTHYFQQEKSVTDSQWDNITQDAKKIISYAKKHFCIELESNDSDKKMINSKRINLNDKHNSYETFYFPKNDKQFNFCKTNQNGYDLVVCAILLAAHHHVPNVYDISSDGESEDWAQASQLNARALGYAYLLPPSLQDSNSAAIEAESADLAKSYVPENIEKEVATKSTKTTASRFKF